MNQARTASPVKIVGAGLIGTSIGLALRSIGVEVLMQDSSPSVLDLSVDFGAGRKYQVGDEPKLIVVATPPDVVARVVSEELRAHPSAYVTDVASVKGPVIDELRSYGIQLSNFVSSHPMAGREQAGALSGRSDIFLGRPWVITPTAESSSQAIAAVEALALDLGASIFRMEPNEHDRAVALVSHAPQLISSLLAGRLSESNPADVALSGQGLRDTTRIAASDPKLWIQILSANGEEVSKVLEKLRDDLDKVMYALTNIDKSGSLAIIGKLLEQGNSGVSKIPGKHGSKRTEYSKITVMIDDRPGELARLLTEVGQIGVNLEDLVLEHATGALVGLPELYVLPSESKKLVDELTHRGWKVVG